MKHFYAALIIFVFIISGSVFTHYHTKKRLSIIESQAKIFQTSESVTDLENQRIKNIKNYFYGKKNMLRLTVSKEHINNIELNILLIENSIRNEDFQSCQEKSIELTNTIHQIERYLTAID